MRSLFLVALTLAACACPHHDTADPTPPDVTPQTLQDAAAGIAFAAVGFEVSADLAADESPRACAVLETVGALGHAVADSLAGEASGEVVFGELAVDATKCGDLALKPIEVHDSAAHALEGLASAVRFRVRTLHLGCRDQARVDGALAYLASAIGPITTAIESGQVKWTIPRFSKSIEGCG